MEFVLDIHCHTLASGHAYSTLNENAEHAKKINLKCFGAADHGPQMPGAPHFYHFANMRVLGAEIRGIRFLKGIEANILNENGEIDLAEEWLKGLDFAIASFHRGIFKNSNIKTNIKL